MCICIVQNNRVAKYACAGGLGEYARWEDEVLAVEI